MADVGKINGVLKSDINRLNGITEATIGKVNDLDFATGAGYVSGAIMHLVAADSSSYSGPGATTWVDISGSTNNVALVNGPTEPVAGDDYIAFDGVDDYGSHTFQSGEYFYGDSSNTSMFTTASGSVVVSFAEAGTTGFIASDAVWQFGSRKQSSGMRCFQLRVERRGICVLLAYGSVVFVKWPSNDPTNFHYNSSRGYWEPKPDRVIHASIRWERSPATGYRHMCAYLNGVPFTTSGFTGGSSGQSGLASSSRINYTYANASAVRRGQAQWFIGGQHNKSGNLITNTLQSNMGEVLLYSSALTDAEMLQNYNAYISAYGPLN